MALNTLVENSAEMEQQDDLQPGTTLLHGQYTITRFLNNGGFGITYLAKDSLDRTVVIKECFADAFCRRTQAQVSARSRAHQGELKSIIRHFIREAQSLSKLKHPNIVGVHQVFEDNDTAYMAIDYVDGRDLQDILDDADATLTPEQITSMTRKLLEAIGYVHDANLLHRDISPDNILLTKDGEPVLIDFGAAREDTSADGRKHSALRVVKDGYSPQEFYIAGSDQGPWSDLYALAASLYHVIKGEAPVNGQARLVAIAEQRPDPYEPLAGAVEGYGDGFLEAIDKAMNTKPAMRLQTAGDWLAMLDGKAVELAAPQAANSTAAPAGADTKRSRLPAVSVLAVLAGLGVAGYAYYGSTGADAVAEAPTAAVAAAEIAEATPAAADPAPAAEERAAVATAETVAAVDQPAVTEAPAEPAAAEPQATAAIEEPAQPEPAAVQPGPFTGHAVSYALWDVSVPFEFEEKTVRKARVVSITGTGENTDLGKTGSWIAPGVDILTVNNHPLTADAPFASQMLTAMQIDPDGYTRASIRYRDAETKRFEMGLLALPVVRRTGMNSGLQFEARMQDGAWVTAVSQQAAQGSADLQPGDILLRETATGTRLTEAESLAEIMQALKEQGAAEARFDILRGEETATVSLTLAGQS
ncbi:hypothetical protein AB838_00995 [Rhodobacteraceae bacterium (ex Bugula neritina AB1)]|nr:hypothetical protein AB838_00995 [Rhodobacteraceae bacterium (ex Bugula neritina AB1)]